MPMQGERVLVVDHDVARRTELIGFLAEAGIITDEATSCGEALAYLATTPVPLIFADVELHDKSGYFLLRRIRDLHPDCEVVLLAQSATDYGLLQALRQGAFDFIMRPLDTGEILLPTLNRAARHLALLREKAQTVEDLKAKTRALGQALAMMRALIASMERLTSLIDVQAVLSSLLDAALTVLGARCGFIALVERKSGDVGIRIAQGYPGEMLATFALKLRPGLITEVIRKGKPLLIADTLPPELAELLDPVEQTQLLPHAGIVAVPLRLGERDAGLVVLSGHPPEHPFTPLDLDFLEQLSHHTTLVLEHVGIILHLQQQGRAPEARD